MFLVCVIKSDLNPWVRALRKQFGELFLARSGEAGTEFQEKLGRRAINSQGVAAEGCQIRLSPPNENPFTQVGGFLFVLFILQYSSFIIQLLHNGFSNE